MNHQLQEKLHDLNIVQHRETNTAAEAQEPPVQTRNHATQLDRNGLQVTKNEIPANSCGLGQGQDKAEPVNVF